MENFWIYNQQESGGKSAKRWIKTLLGLMEELTMTFADYLKRPLRSVIKVKDPYQIPIIINSYNRLTCLKELIDWLNRANLTNIHILDNASTYPPLLAYYKTLPPTITVYYLGKNLGYRALWLSKLYRRFYWNYYVYTDPDVLPIEECPSDFMHVFLKALADNPSVGKVGFGLKIDDIPDCFSKKNEVIKWESRFWDKSKQFGPFYQSAIDTTFALYRPLVMGRMAHWKLKALRADKPYLARHTPWYHDSNKPDEEYMYYRLSQDSNNHW